MQHVLEHSCWWLLRRYKVNLHIRMYSSVVRHALDLAEQCLRLGSINTGLRKGFGSRRRHKIAENDSEALAQHVQLLVFWPPPNG